MGSCCQTVNKPCGCSSHAAPLQTSAELTIKDVLGSWKARWGINRMTYKVEPGLYFVGRPGVNAPVLVTANYKMSFDALRKELADISAWILVLDTKGINVWCAAGKGTFGTEELIKRIDITGLADLADQRTLILPQLGAAGVSAHEVQRRSGFKIVYGPVSAKDLPVFLKNGMKADKEMRTVQFGLFDRVALTPIEMVGAIKPSLITFGLMFLLNLIGLSRFTGTEVYSYIGAIFTGCVLTPILLPWIPGRMFSFKGWLLGLAWAASVIAANGYFGSFRYGVLTSIAYILILPAVSAYYAMNFTGCSTYTSFSGVIKEMKVSIPLIAVSVGLGVILFLTGNLLSL